MPFKETQIWDSKHKAEIPNDYKFVPSGDHFLTRTMKQLCREQDTEVFVKMRKGRKYSQAVAYFVPKNIVTEAKVLKDATEVRRAAERKRRAAYRARKEQQYEESFADRTRELYPSLPESDAVAVAERACEVGSDRVGRSKQIGIDKKIRLALAAYARHKYTNFEEQLAEVHFEDEYLELRRRIAPEVEMILEGWKEVPTTAA